MSIPLIQKPDKDDINTSIIAIKRNIERINMLLGLVDSGSDPDLSGLATKQELQDAITELTPVDEVTVDNMQSVTSNAVADFMGISENDEGLINISNLVTKYLGATGVNVSRKNNIVYLAISGTYTGTQTTTTQQILSGLPEKYRPSFEQSGACMSYASGGNYIYISRLRVGTDGTVYLAECGFPRNSTMRISILYMI